MRVVWLAVGALGLGGLAVGCSGEPPRGKVSGTVAVAGKPVSGATITFENAAAGIAATATVTDGAFTVAMYQGPGLPVGSYKVAVAPGVMMKPGDEIPLAGKKTAPPPPQGAAIPAKYHSVTTSGLTADVKAGENPPLQYDLKP